MTDSLVALRDHREQVIARLSDGYAQDLFDVDELERRLDLAHAARTVAELDALVADLGAAPTTALVVAGPTAIDDPTRADDKRLRVVLGSVERRGRWVVPRRLDLRVWWGNSELDFRDASIGPGVTTIEVRVVMGNLELLVPPQLAVEVDVSSIMGSVTERHRMPPELDPARPVLSYQFEQSVAPFGRTLLLARHAVAPARERGLFVGLVSPLRDIRALLVAAVNRRRGRRDRLDELLLAGHELDERAKRGGLDGQLLLAELTRRMAAGLTPGLEELDVREGSADAPRERGTAVDLFVHGNVRSVRLGVATRGADRPRSEAARETSCDEGLVNGE